MRGQQKPHDRLDARGRIDLLDPNRIELDRGRQALDVEADARTRRLDRAPAHPGSRRARRAAVLGRDLRSPAPRREAAPPSSQTACRRRSDGDHARRARADGHAPSAARRTARRCRPRSPRLPHHRRFAQQPAGFAQSPDPAAAFLRLDRTGNPALPLPRLAPARRRFLAAVDVGVRQSDDPACVADLPRVAVARRRHDHRMQEKPDVAAVADHAKTALAPRVSRKIELRRILDRQHMTAARRLRRMTGRRGEHDLAGHRRVVQKPSIGHIPSAIAAKAAKTGGALGDERRQKLGPLFVAVRRRTARDQSTPARSPPANQPPAHR